MKNFKRLRAAHRMIGLIACAAILIGCSAPTPAPAQPVAPPPDQSVPPDLLPRPIATAGPDDPQVYLFEPEDGSIVTSPVLVRYGFNRLDVDSGRYQLFLLIDQTCAAPGQVIAADATRLIFAPGSFDMEIELPAGPHRLCLQATENGGLPIDAPGMSFVVDITVE